ncbi:Endonuclease III-like protein [Mycena sanguinolenta]|uniref:DNA-(apurinic or apyrimidinic site) lyase n=1 Tax=Mycena sanguinolenta TaxID=230812 RepID=A0A8H6TWA1_9AGAR|nr:Endonuclease III-like protein [Mycena sanguinolenta]
MSGLHRSSPRLKARVSPYHSGVTLYDAIPDSDTSCTSSRPKKRVKVESTTPSGPSISKEASKSPSKRPSKSPQKSKTVYKKPLVTPHAAPPRWREVYDCIKEMRSQTSAPVDTMGCHMAQRYETEPKNKRFVTLVSLMLSPQTKDQVTDAAVCKLREALGGSVSLDAVLAADPAVISEAINKVGMWRVKTKHLKAAAEKLRDNFESDVPKTIEGMISLPGVGPKIGFSRTAERVESVWALSFFREILINFYSSQ